MIDKDPIGRAIRDFSQGKSTESIVVHCDLSEDDILPVPYLFRSFKEMPEMEKIALKRASGRVLDVGAGAGPHALYLLKNGLEVKAIDTSPLAVKHMQSLGIDATERSFLNYNGESFDTILLLMNGIGLAGTLENLPEFLVHCKNLLNPGGRIICDSTDVRYFFEDEEGATWIDLNNNYYGQFRFQMEYMDCKSDWFDWLYLDGETLSEHARNAGLDMEILYEEEAAFLAELTLKNLEG
ncbi:MAG: class I SAM-dependent methyltransferase [Brumimicrobium sp.]|nr:class I SAM-dependent methyltransferase [Brumimicrobium sp.]